jgi:hypothetical protein
MCTAVTACYVLVVRVPGYRTEMYCVKTRAIYFTRRNRPPDILLTLNRRNIPFVNNVKYLGDKRMTWKLHIQMIEAKAFRTFIRIYSLFKSERLSANIKLTLHKAQIWSVMTYACPVWEFAAECHLLKLQRLQNKVLRNIGNFPKRTTVRDMHKAFHMPYVYDYITKSCRHKQKSSKIMKIKMFATLDKAKPDTQNIRGLNLAAVMCMIVKWLDCHSVSH